MDRIKVSILVPAYNVEAYIEECIQSLISQTLKEIEIVIVDDASTDDTLAIAERYATGDSRIHIYRQPKHLGLAAIRELSVPLAHGKYIVFVDSDDSLSCTALEQLYIQAEKRQSDIVLGTLLRCYSDGRKIRMGEKVSVFTTENTVLSGQDCFKRLIDTGCYVPMVCGNLYRTEFICKNDLHFGAYYHEDEYFTPYALFYAQRVSYFDKDFYFYRQRIDSIMHRTDNLKKRAESLSFAGNELISFIQKQTIGIDAKVRRAFREQGKHLCQRSQHLYEKELSISSRRCLLIFSEESIASQYGIGTYIRQLVQCFDTSEWDLHVINLHSSGTFGVKFRLENNVAWYDFPIPPEQMSSNAPIHENRNFKGIFYYWLSRIGDGRKVYCHLNFFGHHYLATLFKEKLGCPIIFTLHYTNWSFELLGNRELLKHYMAQPTGHIKEAFEKEKAFMKECCDRVIAIARHSYNMLHEIYGLPKDKLAYIPNGLKDDYRKLTIDERNVLRKKYHYSENEKIIIFAGRLDLVKGIVELIEAFKEVLKSTPEARLIVAGSGNFSGCLEAAAPWWRQVSFTGFVSKEQLYELYAIADLGVVPSIHEEFGYVATEMMLNVLPVVVHGTTGLKEITDNGKYAVTFQFDEKRNYLPLKEAIIKALKQKHSERYKQNARNWVLRNYTIPSFRKRIMNIYSCMEPPYCINNYLNK